jgi:hypothetical protein
MVYPRPSTKEQDPAFAVQNPRIPESTKFEVPVAWRWDRCGLQCGWQASVAPRHAHRQMLQAGALRILRMVACKERMSGSESMSCAIEALLGRWQCDSKNCRSLVQGQAQFEKGSSICRRGTGIELLECKGDKARGYNKHPDPLPFSLRSPSLPPKTCPCCPWAAPVARRQTRPDGPVFARSPDGCSAEQLAESADGQSAFPEGRGSGR